MLTGKDVFEAVAAEFRHTEVKVHNTTWNDLAGQGTAGGEQRGWNAIANMLNKSMDLEKYGTPEDVKRTLEAAHAWRDAADLVVAGDKASEIAEDDAADELFHAIEKSRGNPHLRA